MKAKRKILIVRSGPNNGGGALYLRQVVKGIKEHFHVTVACSYGDPLWEPLTLDGVEWIPVPFKSKYDVRSVKYLNHLINKYAFDIVHAAEARALFFIMAATMISSTKSRSIKRVWTSHLPLHYKFRHSPVKLFIVNKIINYLSDSVDRIISVSEYLKKYHESRGRDASKIVVIYNGIPISNSPSHDDYSSSFLKSKLGLNEKTKVIAFVGRLDKQKGVEYLIRAASILKARYSSALFFIIGDGPLRQELQSLAYKLHVNENVRFLGYINDVNEIYPIFDIVAMPSLYEGLGYVAIEAAGAGKPVVASSLDVLSEVILDGETGFLVPPGNSELIAGALEKLLLNEKLAHQMGENGRRYVKEKFSYKTMINKHIAIYNDLLT